MQYADSSKQAKLQKVQSRAARGADVEAQKLEKTLEERDAGGEQNRSRKATREIEEQQKSMNRSALFPRRITVKAREGNTIAYVNEGLNNEILYLRAENASYSLNRIDKTFRRLAQDRRSAKSSPKIKITPTDVTDSIGGYLCTKYVITRVVGGEKFQQEVWTTTAISGFDVFTIGRLKIGKSDWSFDAIRGVPLKMVSKSDDETISILVKDIKPQELSPELFAIPANFTKWAPVEQRKAPPDGTKEK